MQELLNRLIMLLRGMWRFRWPAVAVAWAMAVLGWAWVYTMPDVYQAKAQVYVDTETTLRPLLKGVAVETDVMSQVSLMTRALLSRPQLASVARETDLDLRAQSTEEMEELIDTLQLRIRITQDTSSARARDNRENFFTITFEDTDRLMAQNVVQTLLDTFVEDALGQNRSDVATAQRFLQTQIAEYEQRLDQAERRLADFKRRNVGMMPSEGKDYYERLQAEMASLDGLERELSLAQRRRAEIRRQIEGEEPVFGIMGPDLSSVQSVAPEISQKISEYKTQLADLQLNYTDKHPDIIRLKEIIADLEGQREAEIEVAAPEARSATNPLDVNPVYQRLRVELSATEVELADLRAQVGEKRADVEKLRELVDTIPDVEAQLNRLTRDYDVTKAQYEDLLKRLEFARISDDADKSSDDVKFQVLEPPFVPEDPVGPNRPLFLVVVLMGALGAGAALAFALDQTRPVFFSRPHLHEATGLPVLGSISLCMDAKSRSQQRIRHISMAVAMASLLVAFVLVVVFEDRGAALAQSLIG